jgi:UDP-2,3-diacylglucosamine hydrolase
VISDRRAFRRRRGVHLLPESEAIDLYGEPVLLLHGDTLCTDDVDYQAFRAQVRDPAWQARLLELCLWRSGGRWPASCAKPASKPLNRKKPPSPTSIWRRVDQALRAHGIRA